MNPKILLEYIANRNSTKDHHEYLKSFVEAEIKMYGVIYPPYVFSTDCDGALENVCLLTWPARFLVLRSYVQRLLHVQGY